MKNFIPFLMASLAILILLSGCIDPLARNKTLTAVFDGVPVLPSVDILCRDQIDELCKDYGQKGVKVEKRKNAPPSAPKIRSQHPPYAEKNCEGCHNFRSANLLIRPKNQLCFVCHKDFIKGTFVHGPVAVGECLACHVPHDSPNTSLLRRQKTAICAKCHQEKRLAANMHVQVISHNMECVDCHNPHSGMKKYFLK